MEVEDGIDCRPASLAPREGIVIDLQENFQLSRAEVRPLRLRRRNRARADTENSLSCAARPV